MTRVIAVVIILLGILQAGIGVWIPFGYHQFAELLQLANAAGDPMVQAIDTVNLRMNAAATSAVLTTLGTTFLISGRELFRLRERARKLWLGAISFSLVFYGAWFVSDARAGVWWEDWLQLFVWTAIFAVSWSYFTRPTIRRAFLSERRARLSE